MVSGANAVFSHRFRRFPFSGGRPRVVVALVAAIVFAVHLLSMHSGHHGDSGHGVVESVTESSTPSAADVVDVLTVDHPHDEVECGEVTQSRLGVTASALVPALGCLWVLPRPEGLIRSQGPVGQPRSTPHLVRELGVQQV